MSDRSHVLITGGAGFIGSHLTERLLAEGKRVVVIDDLSTGSLDNLRAVENHPGLRFIRSKVSQCAELGELAAGAESIYHLAAVVGVGLVMSSCINTIENNLLETQRVLEAASGQRASVLVASTSEVYGKSSKAVFSEEDDLLIGPSHLSRWSYACSKLMDEFLALGYARERGVPVVVARLFNTVGPRQTGRYGMVLPRFIQAARAGEPLQVYGDGRQTRCFCHVADVVEALTRLQNRPAAAGRVYNVGSDEEVSIGRLAERVIEILKSKSEIQFIPYEQAYAPGFEDMLRRKPLLERLERFAGFRPQRTLEEIIVSAAGL